MDVAVAKLGIDLAVGSIALVVEHERAAQPGRIELSAPQEFHRPASRRRRHGTASFAFHAAERNVEDRPDREVAREREIPADTAGREQAVPLDRNALRRAAVACRECGVVTPIRQAALEVQRAAPERSASADRGLAKVWVSRILVADRE